MCEDTIAGYRSNKGRHAMSKTAASKRRYKGLKSKREALEYIKAEVRN